MKPLAWRIGTNDDGSFDELVVGIGLKGKRSLIHAEMMDDRAIFVSIGGLRIWAFVDKKGRVEVTHTEQDADGNSAAKGDRDG